MTWLNCCRRCLWFGWACWNRGAEDEGSDRLAVVVVGEIAVCQNNPTELDEATVAATAEAIAHQLPPNQGGEPVLDGEGVELEEEVEVEDVKPIAPPNAETGTGGRLMGLINRLPIPWKRG